MITILSITALIFFVAIATFFSIKFLSRQTFGSIESYTSFSALIKKMRALSILSAVLIPVVAYYESMALGLYEANWYLVGIIILVSLISLAISFYKKLTVGIISVAIGSLFVIVVSLIYLISFQRNLNTTLVAEASILLLFSTVVFIKPRHTFYFFVYLTIFLIGLALLFESGYKELSILASTTLIAVLVLVSIQLVENSSVNSLSFANKILRNSNLFVLVADQSGKIVYVSKPLLELTGKGEEELLGNGWETYRNDGNVEQVDLRSHIAKILESDSNNKYVNKLKTENGIVDIEWSDFALDGKFVMGIGKDVTSELKYQKEIEMLSLVATSVTNGVAILDKSNKVIWNNDQLEKLIGLESKEILNEDIIKRLVPIDLEKGTFIRSTAQIKENASQTIRFIGANQLETYVMLSNSLVLNERGFVTKKILVWTDVSDQWKLEKRYREIIDNAFDNIYTADDTGKITYVNKGMEMNLNMSSDQLIGLHYLDLIHPHDKEKTTAFYNQQYKNRELYTYYEYRIDAGNKEELWVGQNVRLVLDDSPDRKVIELHAVARDITENRRNREGLKRLSYVAEKTGSIVVILDNEYCIQWVNETFEKVFGYELSEVYGKNPGDILNGKNTDVETLEEIVEKLKHNEHVNSELINYDKFGNEKWIEITMDPILDENGKVINYVAVENDITKRKDQELLIKTQHKSIIDSLNYASIIQSATLPTREVIDKLNKEVFIYYHPKEIIGGDFYMVDSLINDYGNKLEVYIVADCTGHGVPGAMLSVLCTGILKEAIHNRSVHNPADILNYARNRLLEIFRVRNEHTINDGMDISVCVIDRASATIDYCGANRPLFLMSGSDLKVISGNKQSVGHNHSKKDFTFERLKFKEGDLIYLFSDGVVDQFGGPRDRKIMTSRFKQIISDIQHLSLDDQRDSIQSFVEDWKGTNEQTDDICLMGVRL